MTTTTMRIIGSRLLRQRKRIVDAGPGHRQQQQQHNRAATRRCKATVAVGVSDNINASVSTTTVSSSSPQQQGGQPQPNAAAAAITASHVLPNSSSAATGGLSSFIPSSLSKAAATQAPDTPTSQRWWAVPPANAVHVAIGSVYVYSMWTPGMTHALGVVAASAGDWTHSQVLPIFSTSAVCLGITTSTFGSWVEKVGPRTAGTLGSIIWGSALMTTGVGIQYHSLELMYLGWGCLGGVGWGLMYLSPVTTVMKWFPDRRGLGTGLAVSAFGAGAAIAPAMIHHAVDYFAVAPDFIGPLSELTTGLDPGQYVTLETLSDGTQVVMDGSAVGEPGQPVVVATESDLAKFPHQGDGGVMEPGAYLLGTGDTGTGKAMASLGVFYGALGLLGSRFMRLPHPDWTPTRNENNSPTLNTTDTSNTTRSTTATPPVLASLEKKDEEEKQPAQPKSNDYGLPVDYVVKQTHQFPLLWLSVFGNATGGLALLSSSKLMLTDIWAGVAPGLVTASFGTAYVSALGVGMAAGRFGWSAISDYLGRQNTYALYGLGLPIMGLAPALTHAAVTASHAADPASSAALVTLLSAFCGGSVLAITFYGGIFSVLPAYIADLFGQKHSGAIHGKLLTAWASSAVVGPLGLAYMRQEAATHATHDLLTKVEDTQAFVDTYGCSVDDTSAIQTLLDAKTLSIARLMEMVPAGTVDPTPYLYDTTCYAAAGLMGVSFIANQLIKPIDVQARLQQIEAEKEAEKVKM